VCVLPIIKIILPLSPSIHDKSTHNPTRPHDAHGNNSRAARPDSSLIVVAGCPGILRFWLKSSIMNTRSSPFSPPTPATPHPSSQMNTPTVGGGLLRPASPSPAYVSLHSWHTARLNGSRAWMKPGHEGREGTGADGGEAELLCCCRYPTAKIRSIILELASLAHMCRQLQISFTDLFSNQLR
jgi:hypothetical protein